MISAHTYKATALRLLWTKACALALAVFALGACKQDGAQSAGQSDQPAAAQQQQQVPDSVKAMTDSILRIADASRISGDSTAPVWFITISDFQCPICRRFHDESYARIRKDYVDKGLVRMAYINLPNPMNHPHALVTAEHALCAGLQRKFWEYHDALFKNFDAWNKLPAGTDYFDKLAGQLNLDMEDLQLCTSSGVMQALIRKDAISSDEAGVTGTPSFLIGGRKIVGLQTYDVLSRQIDLAISAARKTQSGGSGGSGGGM